MGCDGVRPCETMKKAALGRLLAMGPLSINVLTVGKRVHTGGGFVKVTSIERV